MRLNHDARLKDCDCIHCCPPKEQTWPDIDQKCEEAIKQAFGILNTAPGFRKVYADVQNKLAEAIRILRGME